MFHAIFQMEVQEEPFGSLPLYTVTRDCHCQPPRPADQASVPILYCPRSRGQQGLVGSGYIGKGVGGRQSGTGEEGGEGSLWL